MEELEKEEDRQVESYDSDDDKRTEYEIL